MALEFNKLVDQIQKMGYMLQELDITDIEANLALAIQQFKQAPDLATVQKRIDRVRQSDIRGYRGAAPLSGQHAEPINAIYDPPTKTEEAVIVAVDGSQIYPDEQIAVHYYLINLGVFVYFQGRQQVPFQTTYPKLYYQPKHVHDQYGRVIANRIVDDRRAIAEMQMLAEMAWELREQALPIIALYDNRLLYTPTGGDKNEAETTKNAYHAALTHLHDSGAILAGYIDNPYRSKRMIQLLYLLTLENEEAIKQNQKLLSRAGPFEGLVDRMLFDKVLKPGQRSAIMVQNSPTNKKFRERGESHEIAYFYLKIANAATTRVVRIDIPVWVTWDKKQVDLLHSTLLEQCRIQGSIPYPYAITRADELAVVQRKERDRVKQMIDAEVRRVRGLLSAHPRAAKARSKERARGEKRSFEV